MEEKRMTEVFERTASTGKECVKDHNNKIQDDGLPNTTLQGAKCSARSTSIMVYGYLPRCSHLYKFDAILDRQVPIKVILFNVSGQHW